MWNGWAVSEEGEGVGGCARAVYGGDAVVLQQLKDEGKKGQA